MKKQSLHLGLSITLISFLAACSHKPIDTGLADNGAIPNDEPVASVDAASPPASIDESPPTETFPGADLALATQQVATEQASTSSEKRVRHRGTKAGRKSAARKSTGRRIAKNKHKHKLDTRKETEQNAVTVAQVDAQPPAPPSEPPQAEIAPAAQTAAAPAEPLTMPLAAAVVPEVPVSGSSDWFIWVVFGLVAAGVVLAYHTTKKNKAQSWPHSHGV